MKSPEARTIRPVKSSRASNISSTCAATTQEDDCVVNHNLIQRLSIYVRAGRAWIPTSTMATFAVLHIFTGMFTAFWVTFWSEHSINELTGELRSDGRMAVIITSYTGALVFAVITIASILCAVIASFAQLKLAWQASISIHDSLLQKLFNATMTFFDTTPSGHIMNRASTDIAVVDDELPTNFSVIIYTTTTVLSILSAVAFITPIILILIVPAMLTLILLQNVYVPASRNIQSLACQYTSPLIKHFTETLAGSSTIRAFSQEQRFSTLLVHVSVSITEGVRICSSLTSDMGT